MYITKACEVYILWSDKRNMVMVSSDRDKVNQYIDILIKKKNAVAFDSWLYMCLKYNICTS
jgi:hypothetical protein